MKITSININDNLANLNGFKPFTMNRLGKLVLLSGVNGAGKTTLLKLLHRRCEPDDALNDDFEEIEDSICNVCAHKVTRSQKKSTGTQQEINSAIELLASAPKSCLKIFPITNRLEGIENLTRKEISERARRAGRHFSEYSYTTIPKLENITRLAVAASSDLVRPLKGEQICLESKKRYDNLCRVILSFLGTTPSINEAGEFCLFGKPIEKAKLSDGQKILLKIAMAFFEHVEDVDNISSSVVLIDEPECRLHPQVVNYFLEKLHSVIQDGQIWIATHSPHVISHFGVENLWAFDEKKVSYFGKNPDCVLKSLLGDEFEKEIYTMLNTSGEFNIIDYAAQCLGVPQICGAGDVSNRDIFETFDSLLANISGSSRPLILDYGAGKGRFLRALDGKCADIEYIAYDKTQDSHVVTCCKDSISAAYESSSSRYYNDNLGVGSLFTDLKVKYRNKIWATIMINVLHEIEPTEWVSVFSKKDGILSLMKRGGLIFIGECKTLWYGENAHKFGFIVHTKSSISKLFKCNIEHVKSYASDSYNVFVLESDKVKEPTNTSVLESIKVIMDSAHREIECLRKHKIKSFKNSKELAFWSMQYVNASAYAEQFK